MKQDKSKETLEQIALRVMNEANKALGYGEQKILTVREEEFSRRLKAEIEKQQEPVFAFRRKGLDYFCTCSEDRYNELAQKPRLFEVRILYPSPISTPEEVKDAARWNAMSALMFIGEVSCTQDEDGGYSISVDPVENIIGKTWSGNSPEECIDAAMSAELGTQGEEK